MPSVLLVHGDAQMRASVGQALVQRGCHVSAVDQSRAGFDAALSQGFDLIVWDAALGLLDGEPVPELLRAMGFAGPVLALVSGSDTDVGSDGFPAQVRWVEGGESFGVDALLAALPAPAPSRWEDLTFESVAGFDRLQQRYRARLPAEMAALRAAWVAQEWGEVRRLAHALKGAAACFGLPDVSTAAEAVELGCTQDDRQLIDNGLEQLLASVPATQDREAGSSTRDEGSLA